MVQKKNPGKLRYGFTTGSCAAAAAKAATMCLLHRQVITQVEIDLPDNGKVSFNIKRCEFDSHHACCSVIKDAGDDPDITDGAEITATIIFKKKPGITITGGTGVGTVTKPGMEIPVGMAAINTVPRQMIEHSVEEALQNHPEIKGAEVTISVIGGEKLAKKTLNPRLGIVGGISIIGTTGIVIPYSIDAYKASIAQALDIAAACGCRRIVLTTGRRSEKYAQHEFALSEESFIQAGDFIGYSLEQCVRKNIPGAIIWGMTGKISKLAAGHLYTNISDSQVDIGFLTELAADCGLPEEKLNELKSAVTANHLRRLLPEHYVQIFCNNLCRLAAEKCRDQIGDKLQIECIISDYNGVILGRYPAGE